MFLAIITSDGGLSNDRSPEITSNITKLKFNVWIKLN